MDNARKYPCEILYKTNAPKYDEDICLFQGCPTVAVTHGGRIYLGWYAGGTREPHMDIDTRQSISYPDAQEKDGVIYLTYDHKRTSEREILFAKFTEDDVISKKDIEISTVSKPKL